MAEKKTIRLTQTVQSAGWACKIGPGDLAEILRDLPLIADPNLLTGIEHAEDAGV